MNKIIKLSNSQLSILSESTSFNSNKLYDDKQPINGTINDYNTHHSQFSNLLSRLGISIEQFNNLPFNDRFNLEFDNLYKYKENGLNSPNSSIGLGTSIFTSIFMSYMKSKFPDISNLLKDLNGIYNPYDELYDIVNNLCPDSQEKELFIQRLQQPDVQVTNGLKPIFSVQEIKNIVNNSQKNKTTLFNNFILLVRQLQVSSLAQYCLRLITTNHIDIVNKILFNTLWYKATNKTDTKTAISQTQHSNFNTIDKIMNQTNNIMKNYISESKLNNIINSKIQKLMEGKYSNNIPIKSKHYKNYMNDIYPTPKDPFDTSGFDYIRQLNNDENKHNERQRNKPYQQTRPSLNHKFYLYWLNKALEENGISKEDFSYMSLKDKKQFLLNNGMERFITLIKNN